MEQTDRTERGTNEPGNGRNGHGCLTDSIGMEWEYWESCSKVKGGEKSLESSAVSCFNVWTAGRAVTLSSCG